MVSTPTDHAAERRAILAFIETLEKDGAILSGMRAKLDALHPPQEPERVWVTFIEKARVQYSRNPDGSWSYRDENSSRTSSSGVTDKTVSALASLVPGLVVKPMEPTAWITRKRGVALDRIVTAIYASRGEAEESLRRFPIENGEIVGLAEVPRDA